MFDKHTKSAAFQGLVQIMRHPVSNNGHSQTLHRGVSPYHRYKGLSNIQDINVWIIKQGMPGYKQDIPDTKHYIYKHHMFDIGRYKGLADMKV